MVNNSKYIVRHVPVAPVASTPVLSCSPKMAEEDLPHENNTVRECDICSTPTQRIRHRHFSSLWLRNAIGVEANGTRFLCPSCKSRHLPYLYNRTKLVVADSSLHTFFAPPGHTGRQYDGDLIHTDYITIPGATIDELTRAFSVEYRDFRFPLDVIMVAGYADILEGRSRYAIIESFSQFSRAVLATNSGHDGVNTVAICSLLYPPQLAWFDDNGPLPYHHPGNQLLKLEFLNEAILSLNLDNRVTEFPRLHKYGIRNYTKRYVDSFGQIHNRRIKQHRLDHWLGADPARMLYLVNEQRFKVGAAVNKYFSLRTNWELLN